MGVKFGVEEGIEGPLLREPHRCNGYGIGPPKLNFLLRFDQNVNINAPRERMPCAIFIRFADFVHRFMVR